ncbi:dihydrofolate reductase family protein [Streptomyces sp. NBC_00249]|uniref:dihydrofolate reductase family protein n=1 Tax=Streptomyces sp. NBC_00249 TaxID=2975690 RepID=UPI002252F5EF|nr:dihydrofolate reductase family protein [Streptomyces sp. NBC_00249]MCX5193552.1 dihydrofolate reductase family protein [Streptomyces sp. NBC_00249]
MGKLTLTTFLTLDGVMQAPGGPEEDTTGGFAYGGWVVPYADEGMGEFIGELFGRAGAFLLGRRTYEIFASYWPGHDDPADPVAGRLNRLPKYVASTTLKEAAWGPATVVDGEQLQAEVVRAKDATDGELQVHGSGQLARWLLARDLVEELNLLVFPVLLGAGQRLFEAGALPTAFELAASRSTGSGIAIHTYRLAGRASFGTFMD